jgi:chromosome partitioning protein
MILPLPCEYFALEGMQQLLNTIRLVRDRLNPSVSLFGVVLTMYDPRKRLAAEVVDEIKQHFPETFNTLIPNNVRLLEAPSFGLTILEHDRNSPGATAYTILAKEVIARAAAMEDTHA